LHIDPRNKKAVGPRLALWALKDVYGQRHVIAQGPTFVGAARAGAALRVRFDDHQGGLAPAAGGAPPGLALCRGAPGACGGRRRAVAVAGADLKWSWSEARLAGDAVIVSSPAVPEPVAVRY